MKEYIVSKITRIVVVLHAGMGIPIAITDKDGNDAVEQFLELHKDAPIIYDGPPNQ